MQGAKQGTSSEAKGQSVSFQVRAKEPVLENFCRAFSPGPTDCPWASEDEQGSVNRQRSEASLPWLPEVFLACAGNFRCWPKAVATSGEALLTITCRFDTSLLRRVVN